VIALLGLIVGGLALIGLRARPTVSLDAPLDVNDVLSTPFLISNDGMLALRDVQVVSYGVRIQYLGGSDETNNVISQYVPPSRVIEVVPPLVET
jgi:hypothetical protein